MPHGAAILHEDLLKERPGTGFYLRTFLFQPAGFLYGKIKTERKRASGRRRLENPAGRSPPGNLLYGIAEAKVSYIYQQQL
jgi:hypothetical protein